jgi:hypothetical protein
MKVIKSANNSNNNSADYGYNSDSEKFKKQKFLVENTIKSIEKSLDKEISFNLSEEDDKSSIYKKNINKIKSQRSISK